jgi:hypothetical protein
MDKNINLSPAGLQDHILLSQFLRLPQPGGPGPRIHIPQGTGWPRYFPGQWVPFPSLPTTHRAKVEVIKTRLHTVLETQGRTESNMYHVGFEFLTAVVTKVATFWDTAPCSLYLKRFGGKYHLHLYGGESAEQETRVLHATRSYILQGGNFQYIAHQSEGLDWTRSRFLPHVQLLNGWHISQYLSWRQYPHEASFKSNKLRKKKNLVSR